MCLAVAQAEALAVALRAQPLVSRRSRLLDLTLT
jgi:hypothetical protein